jgi:hypothetical protein
MELKNNEKSNSGISKLLPPENKIYLPEPGRRAGASQSPGAGKLASAGAGASGFGVSAGLQPKVNATNNINDNTNAITLFINSHLLPI